MKICFQINRNICKVVIFVCYLLIGISFIIGSSAMAQDCFTETTCSITPTSYTINTNTTWSSVNYRINSDILITSGATLTIDDSILDIAAGLKISVNTGCTLEIQNGSKLYCSGTWIGIIAKDGATVKVHDSGTAIADATVAINAKNNVTGATETDLEITDDALFVIMRLEFTLKPIPQQVL